MDKLSKFKTALVNDLNERSFSAVPSVFKRIADSGCDYDELLYATLSNTAMDELTRLAPQKFITQLLLFIDTLKGTVKITVEIRYRFPGKPIFFIGRESVLTDIHQRLTGQTQNSPILLLTGVGGMGKTTLMQQYLNSPACQEYFNGIAMVSVNKNLKQAFIQGAAAALGEQENMKTIVQQDKQLEHILNKMMQSEGDNLFVVDNINECDIDDLRDMKKHFLASGWKFLITTRTAPDMYEHKVAVEELHEEEALLLFAYHYAKDNAGFEYDRNKIETYIASSGIRDEALALLQHIVRHTLLTELLAKTGKLKGYRPGIVLQKLEQEDLKHSDLDRVIYTGSHADNTFREELSHATVKVYINNLFETEYLVIETGNENKDAENKKMATMLRFFSVLPADDIPIEDLKTLWRVDNDEVSIFENRLNEIKQVGWIKDGHAAEMMEGLTQALLYKMHPVVQDVVYDKLEPNIDNCRPLVRTITEQLSGAIKHPRRFQKYAQAVIDNLNLLDAKKQSTKDA